MVICLDIGILRKAFWRKASLNLIGKIKFQKPLLYKFSRKEIFFFTFFLIHQIQYLPLQMLNSSLGAHLLLGSLWFQSVESTSSSCSYMGDKDGQVEFLTNS